MRSKQIDQAVYACVLTALMGSLSVQAEDNMRFKGTLIAPPPCVINGGTVIEVNFGDDLVTSRIDGINYRKDIEYSLDCRNAGTNTVKMQVKGTGASFDGTVLATVERKDLGIGLLTGSATKMNINSWINVQFGDTPRLRAVPVKAEGSQLQSGTFSSGATMMIEYQ